jgi:hypothetical protein
MASSIPADFTMNRTVFENMKQFELRGDSMKKLFFLHLSIFLLIMTLLPVSLASAAGPSLTVSAQVDLSTKTVTITGTISSGVDQQVSVVVTGPSGSVDYIDQTTSDSEGIYAFQHLLDDSESGIYTVKVGGSGASSPVTTSFTFTALDGKNAVTGVTLSPEILTLDTETFISATLIATVSPSDATNKQVEWSSSDESVATVSQAGVVTVQGAGSGTITVTTEDGGRTVIVPVTVNDATAPTAPTDLTGKSTKNTVKLNWQASMDNVEVTGYEVEVWQGNTLLQTVSVSKTTFKITGLSSGTTYSYKVKAKDEAGNVSVTASLDVKTKSHPKHK